MLACPCISIINPTGSIIYSFITNLSNTRLAGDTMVRNAKSTPLWNLYSNREDSSWSAIFFLVNFIFKIVCDVFDCLTPIIYSHFLCLPVLEVNCFGVLWDILKALLRVCLSKSSSDFASSKMSCIKSPSAYDVWNSLKFLHVRFCETQLCKNNLCSFLCSVLV